MSEEKEKKRCSEEENHTPCENNINTVAEKPENRNCVVLLSMMKH